MRGSHPVDEGDTRSRQGFMDLTDIPLPDDIQVFACGPLPFMRLVRSTLLDRGVPRPESAMKSSAPPVGGPNRTRFGEPTELADSA